MTDFTVVVNDEEQYSVWATARALPAGWREVGTVGTREECLAYIDQTWTDMRPLSLHHRDDAAGDAAGGAAETGS